MHQWAKALTNPINRGGMGVIIAAIMRRLRCSPRKSFRGGATMKCPECDCVMDRREFLRTAGAAVVATAAAGIIGTGPVAAAQAPIQPAGGAPESLVKLLYNSL